MDRVREEREFYYSAPHSIEAEASVLGAMILDVSYLEKGLELLLPEDFYFESHRIIFKAIMEVYDRYHQVSTSALIDALKSKGLLEKAGGEAYLKSLVNEVLNLGLFDTHVQI